MRWPRRRFLFPIVLLVCGIAAAAENDSSYRAALESIRADVLGQRVEELADADMEGREAGTRGGLKAAEFLVEQYAQLPLRKAGTDGQFLQPFAPNFRNVLAMLDGADPLLRAQVIVVCAHYDHVGYGGRGLSLGPYGYVHPGADDNASGTAAVLALARAMTLLAAPPKRSILFAAWDAEEKGLLGSRHWACHPTVPLERVAAVLNLDMVGRLRDNQLFIYGSRSGYGWRRLLSHQNDPFGLRLVFSWDRKPNADHAPFFDRDIPALLFHTGLHDDYHRPSDAACRINSAGIEQIARLLFGLLHELANRPAALPGFRAAARHENAAMEKELLDKAVNLPDEPLRCGIVWRVDDAEPGAIILTHVAADSPAAQAGLAAGDRIYQIGGRDFADEEAFALLAKTLPFPLQLLVERDGRLRVVELRPPAAAPLQRAA